MVSKSAFVVTLLLILVGLVSSVLSAPPTQLVYKQGQQIEYTLHAQIDARGQIVSTAAETGGSVSTMDSVLVVRCQQVKQGSYIFVMNMFDTNVHVSSQNGDASSFVKKRVDSGMASVAAGSQPLGYDVFFEQQTNGEITTIWYDRRDESYILNVKLSAINSLQTRVTQPGQSQSAVEQDPTGVHSSEFLGKTSATNDESILVDKAFNQKDFHKFSDPNLTQNNVAVQARTTTGIHSTGFIANSQVEQVVLAVNMGRGPSSASRKSATNDNTTGFDMDMRSRGVLSISLRRQSILSATNSAYFAENIAQTHSQLDTNPELVTFGNLFEAALPAVASAKNELPILEQSVSASLKQVMTDGCIKKHYATIQKIIAHCNAKSDIAVNALLEPYFVQLAKSNDKYLREKLFFLATSMSRENAHSLLVKFGLKNAERTIQYHTMLAISSGVKHPSSFLLSAVLQHFYSAVNDAEMSDVSLLAFGSLLSQHKAGLNKQTVDEGRDTLIKILVQSLKNNNTTMSVSALGAISNAGSTVVPLSAIPSSVFSHGDIRVRIAAAFALKNYRPETYPNEATNLMKSYPFGSDPDYPYNRNYTAKYQIGGEKISADFEAQLFVGTNFDCNQPSFNFKGLAEATAHINVLGISQPALDARAVYGKKGSQLVGDELFLSVFGKVLYQRSLGRIVDCNEHTYALYHAAPGVSVSYTLWVSVVPVTFKASASVELNASWGWQICDDKLSAMIEILPAATLVVSGNAEINLLIVRGGIDLNAKFSAQLVPQAYVHGSECTVGIDVKLDTKPMTAALEGYYATKVCHFLKFWNCKWDKQGKHTFWSWGQPSQSRVLYKQEWKIAGNQ